MMKPGSFSMIKETLWHNCCILLARLLLLEVELIFGTESSIPRTDGFMFVQE